MRQWNKSAAFTLSEVLITLLIIGVVAAITIPTLMNNVNNNQVVEEFTVANSVLNEAVKQYMGDNGCLGDLKSCGLFNGAGDEAAHAVVWTEISPYFSKVKDCGNSGGLGCFNKVGVLKWLDGSFQTSFDNPSGGKALLANGMSVYVEDLSGVCNTAAGKTVASILSKSCGVFTVDVNGPKSPNQFGRDTFQWWITNSGAVVPLGTPQDANYAYPDGTPRCDLGGSGVDLRGSACGGRILMEHAINY